MSKWKRICACVCAGALALSLAGCGGNDNKKAENSGNKKIQIEYWHVASESFGGATVKELVADFN